MSKHDGVSCDSCSKNNFSGDRYKCLRCFDFDLCRECHEMCRFGNGNEHTADHPVQCVMTREDFEFAYWGESASSDELRIMAFSCPYCAQMGFSQSDLYEHVSSEHIESGLEVICPICVATPNADPNRLTDDLAGHLISDHITYGRQDRTQDESRVPRRLYHGGGVTARDSNRRGRARIAGGGTAASQTSRTAASAAGAADPIAELLTQLGGIRRANSNYSSTLAQIQQLQQQLGRRVTRREGRVVAAQAASDVPPTSRHAGRGGGFGGGSGRGFGDSAEVYDESFRAAVSDANVMQLWTELVGGSGTTPSSTALLNGSLGYVVREKDKTTNPPPKVVNNNRNTVGFIVKQDGNQIQTQDSRLLTPRLFEQTLTNEEKQAEQKLLLDRSEFVSELLLALAINEDDVDNDMKDNM